MSREINGWRWTMFAGFIPVTAGLFTLLTTFISTVNVDSEWTLIVRNLNFSYGDLAALDLQAGAFVTLLAYVGGINIVSAAVAVILISIFGLRYGQKWAWWYLAFSLVWVGFHDVYGATKFFFATGAPMFIMPIGFCILMLVGLIKTRPLVFSNEQNA